METNMQHFKTLASCRSRFLWALARLTLVLSGLWAGAATATAQIVLHETLTNRNVWSYRGGGITTVTGSSEFGVVDKLSFAQAFTYTRDIVTLRPGTYRAVVRHRKTTGRDKQNLMVKVAFLPPLTLATKTSRTINRPPQVAYTPARAIVAGEWQHTKELEFRLTSTERVIFTFGNTESTDKRNWLFDSFTLERTAFHGDRAEDQFGRSVSGAGDVNGDGFADVIVGAPWTAINGPYSGSARVISGKEGRILHIFNGDSAYDSFGTSVSGAGDVNGDGFADVIVGAPGDSTNGWYHGRAWVFSGKNGSVLHTFDGSRAWANFGYSVSGAGDVNRDGYADLVVGAPGDTYNGASRCGSARVISGRDGRILFTRYGDSAWDGFGTSVSGAGDLNGDGYADMVVGAPGDDDNGVDCGIARALSGINGSTLYTRYGDSAGDRFGTAVSDAGDVNRDGQPDVIVGAPYDDNRGTDSGSVRVLSGRHGLPLSTFNGHRTGASLGSSVSGAGDVNSDGHDDLFVGAGLDDTNGTDSGSARLFSGKDGQVLYSFNGDSGARCGYSVSGAGDVNGDGFADLIFGTPGASWSVGKVRIVLGKSVHHGERLTFNGNAAGNVFGASVSGAGDVNGDGFDDVIIGAPQDSSNGTDSGRVQVRSGRNGLILYTWYGGKAKDWFGASVSAAGDVNADGFADVIVGAPGANRNDGPQGSAVVYSGRDGSTLYTLDLGGRFKGWAGARFGASVSGVGDVNGDGHADLVVGAWNSTDCEDGEGSVWVYSGRTGTVLWGVHGQKENLHFGHSVSGAGDVNGDGFADVIVGDSGTGSAKVLSGQNGMVLRTLHTKISATWKATEVSGAGDVNGDGFADLIVGVPYDNRRGTESGSVRIYSGSDGRVLHAFYGNAGDRLGSSVSSAGDIDGDGIPDLIVGAHRYSLNGILARGRALVFSGNDGRILCDFVGADSHYNYGYSVGKAGDVNGDGFPDLIVGAPHDDTPRNPERSSSPGGAHVILSQPYKTPGKATIYGPPSADARGYLPRIGMNGWVITGRMIDITLRSAPANTNVILVLGPRVNIQATDYRILADLVRTIPARTSASGTVRLPLSVLNILGQVGAEISMQWWIMDPVTRRVCASDGLTVRQGSPFPN